MAPVHVIRHIEEVSGGRVIEVRFTADDNGPGWDAAVDQGEHIDFVRLVSEEGQPITLTENSRPTWSLHWPGRNDVHYARTAKVSLVDAIRSAESAEHEPAVAAGIATLTSNPDRGVTAYNVLLADPDGTVRRAVDADTGQVIANPSALAGWP